MINNNGQLRRVLVGVSSIVDPQLGYLKRVAKYLYRMSDVHGVSSVYHYREDDIEGLSVVYSLRTQLEPLALFKRIKEVERSLRSPHVNIVILLIEDMILRTPLFVVPSEQLHVLKKWCVPAADLWGDCIHPIENKELKVLSESTGSNEKIEFYAQSKSLLDFLSLET